MLHKQTTPVGHKARVQSPPSPHQKGTLFPHQRTDASFAAKVDSTLHLNDLNAWETKNLVVRRGHDGGTSRCVTFWENKEILFWLKSRYKFQVWTWISGVFLACQRSTAIPSYLMIPQWSRHWETGIHQSPPSDGQQRGAVINGVHLFILFVLQVKQRHPKIQESLLLLSGHAVIRLPPANDARFVCHPHLVFALGHFSGHRYIHDPLDWNLSTCLMCQKKQVLPKKEFEVDNGPRELSLEFPVCWRCGMDRSELDSSKGAPACVHWVFASPIHCQEKRRSRIFSLSLGTLAPSWLPTLSLLLVLEWLPYMGTTCTKHLKTSRTSKCCFNGIPHDEQKHAMGVGESLRECFLPWSNRWTGYICSVPRTPTILSASFAASVQAHSRSLPNYMRLDHTGLTSAGHRRNYLSTKHVCVSWNVCNAMELKNAQPCQHLKPSNNNTSAKIYLENTKPQKRHSQMMIHPVNSLP